MELRLAEQMPILFLLMRIDDLTYAIIDAAFKVHSELGPGLLERFYQAAMEIQLAEEGLKVIPQAPVPVFYKGKKLGDDCRMDLLVEDTVIVELKSVEYIPPVCHKQLLSYLRFANKQVGLLINFNESDLKLGIHRIVNNYVGNSTPDTPHNH